MRLKQYSESDFPTLQSWVTDPDLLFQFAGSSWSFPLSAEQVHSYMHANPIRRYYIALDDDDKPLAYGEIIVGDKSSPRVGRLLIGGSDNRGNGLGTRFIHLLIEETKRLFNAQAVYLYVLEDNFPAIRCYEKIGFIFETEGHISDAMNGKEKSILLMKLTLQ